MTNKFDYIKYIQEKTKKETPKNDKALVFLETKKKREGLMKFNNAKRGVNGTD